MLKWLHRVGTPVVDALYPNPTPEGRRSQRAAAVGAVVLAAFAFVFNLVRQPGSALDSPWAEDGAVFLNAAYRLPWWHALFLSYNGYVSVYPSGVALVAASGPVKWAAAVLAVGGALAAAVAVLVTVLAPVQHLALSLRLLLGLAVAAFPLAGAEIAGNSCNAHWYFILATFWCLLWRPRGTPARILITVLPFVSAASDPLTGLLIPLAVLRSVAGPAVGSGTGRHRWPRALVTNLPGLGLLAGLLPQATTLLRPSLHPVAVHPSGLTLLATWVYKGPELALLGPDMARRAGWWGLAAGCVAVVAALYAAFRGRAGGLATASVFFSAVTFAVPSYVRWDPANGLFSSFGIQSRYCFLPWALALVAFALGAQGLFRRPGRAAPTLAVAVLALVICVPAALDADTGRDRSPSWIRQVRAEHTICVAALSRGGDRGVEATLVVAPRASYRVRIPCSRFTGR